MAEWTPKDVAELACGCTCFLAVLIVVTAYIIACQIHEIRDK